MNVNIELHGLFRNPLTKNERTKILACPELRALVREVTQGPFTVLSAEKDPSLDHEMVIDLEFPESFTDRVPCPACEAVAYGTCRPSKRGPIYKVDVYNASMCRAIDK